MGSKKTARRRQEDGKNKATGSDELIRPEPRALGSRIPICLVRGCFAHHGRTFRTRIEFTHEAMSRMKRDATDLSEPERRARPGRICPERSEDRGNRERSRSTGRALQRPGYGPGASQQRSVVKLQYVANRTPGGWQHIPLLSA